MTGNVRIGGRARVEKATVNVNKRGRPGDFPLPIYIYMYMICRLMNLSDGLGETGIIYFAVTVRVSTWSVGNCRKCFI